MMTMPENNNSYDSYSRGWKQISPIGKIASICLFIIILAAIATIIWILSYKPNMDTTEFYLLNEYGQADDYPVSIALGEDISVIVGVVNNEKRDLIFSIRTSINSIPAGNSGPANLAFQERFEELISVEPLIAGDHQKVEFVLFNVETQSELRSLILWVDVAE